MDSTPLYARKRRRARSSRIAYPIFFITVALISLGIVAAARPFAAERFLALFLPAVSTDTTTAPTPNEGAAQNPMAGVPTLTPTPVPQLRAEPVSVRADCTRTAIHGHVYTGEYGVNNLSIRIWFPQGGLPREWQAVTGSDPAWGNGGYDITLESQPVGGVWFVAVVDNSGTPISDIISIETDAEGCSEGTGKQVVHLNFQRTAGEAGALALLSPATPIPTPSLLPPPVVGSPTPPPPPPTITPTPPPLPSFSDIAAPPPLASDRTGRALRVPILMYHYISVPPTGADSIRRGLSVGPDVFRAQLITLRDQGYTSITMRDLAYALEMGSPLPPKPIVLTFDDGYLDNYTNAFPIMKEEGFVGTFYIFTNVTEERNNGYMTWEMVAELQAAGMEIGSHTLTHADLPGKNESWVRRELQESRNLLEQRLGVEIRSFAYPYGHYDGGIAHLAKEAGYWTAVTTRGGTVHSQNNVMTLRRVRVQGGMFPERLLQIVEDPCFYEVDCE